LDPDAGGRIEGLREREKVFEADLVDRDSAKTRSAAIALFEVSNAPVLTDLMGKSGRAMLEALIAGETNPAKLAGLADRRVKASPEEFREALRGRATKHHRFLLRLSSQSDRRS
jgi:hypothetical protein